MSSACLLSVEENDCVELDLTVALVAVRAALGKHVDRARNVTLEAVDVVEDLREHVVADLTATDTST